MRLCFTGLAAATGTTAASLLKGKNSVTVIIPGSATKGARLWHPHGNGDQVRYNVTASFAPDRAQNRPTNANGTHAAAAAPASTWRLLGFRHVALVTINDTDAEDAEKAKDTDGTGEFPRDLLSLVLCRWCLFAEKFEIWF